jgi:hypothetical protein
MQHDFKMMKRVLGSEYPFVWASPGAFLQDMGIDHGRLDILVTEQFPWPSPPGQAASRWGAQKSISSSMERC